MRQTKLLFTSLFIGFSEGMVVTYGKESAAGYTDTNSGVYSDGDKGRTFVYIFCCRNDGSTSNELQVDLVTHFILFPTTGTCQPIRGEYLVVVVVFFSNKGRQFKTR